MKNAAQHQKLLSLICYLFLTICNSTAQTCQQATYPGSLSGTISSVGSGVYAASGNLDVTSNVTISNAEILMDPYSTITVHSGGKLTISGSHIYSCTDMWDGIRVLGGGYLILQQGSNHDNTLIEDADIAVKLESYGYDGVPSGQKALSVTNTIFNRNRIGIDLSTSMYTYTTYPGTLPTYPFYIKNSIFTCRDIPFAAGSNTWVSFSTFKNLSVTYPNTPLGFSAPYIDESTYSSIYGAAYLKNGTGKSAIGINIGDIHHADFNGVYRIGETANGSGTTNVTIFDNQTIGIKLGSADAVINNCTFQHEPSASHNGPTYGIFAYHYDEEYHTLTTAAPDNTPRNAFFDCGHAIKVDFFTKAVLDDNDIRSSKTTTGNSVNEGKEGITIRASSYGAFASGGGSMFYTNETYARNNQIANIRFGITFMLDDWPGFYYYPIGPSGNVTPVNTIEVNNNQISNGNNLGSGFSTNAAYSCEQAINLEVVIPTNAYPTVVPPLRCMGNQINTVEQGIRISGWDSKDIRVLNNLIQMNTDAVTTGHNNARGIWLQGNIPQTALGNFVYFNQGTVGTYSGYTKPLANTRFLEVDNGQEYNVRCNTGTKARHNIIFDGIMPTVDFYTNTMAPDVASGHLSSNGLTLNNAIIGTQGNASNACGNNYDDDANYLINIGGLKTYCINADATLSPMYVLNTVGNFQHPDNWSGAIGTPYAPYSFSNSSLLWASAATLENCDPVSARSTNNNSMVAFQHEMDSIKLEERIKLATGSTRIMGSDSALRLYVAQLQLYRFLSGPNGLAAQHPALQQFMATGKTNSFGIMDSIIAALSRHDSSSAKSWLNGWNRKNRVDDNYYQYFNWILQRGLGQTVSLNEVEALAQACPQTDGNVVFLAQNLYNAVTNQHRIFTSACDISNYALPYEPVPKNTGGTKQLAESSTQLYPNPATNEVKVKGSNIALVEVYSMIGTKLYGSKTNMNTKQSIISIPLSKMATGLYIIKVYNSTGAVSSHKLIKQ